MSPNEPIVDTPMNTRRPPERNTPEVWKSAVERAGLGVWDWDLRTDMCYYSASWFAMLGYDDGELEQASDLWIKLVHPDDRDRAIQSGDQHIYGDAASIETELRLRHKDGHWVWVLDRGGIVEWDEDGKPVRVIGVQTDITRQKSAEIELEQTNWRFQLALEASHMGIWQFDTITEQSYWDPRTREIFGLEPGAMEVPRSAWHDNLHPEDKARAEAAHAIPTSMRGTSKVRYRIIRSDGEIRHVETLAQYAEKSGWKRVVGTIRDVTDEVIAAETLEAEKERFRVTLRAIDDGVVSTDTDGRITYVNRAARKLLGLTEAMLLGSEFEEAMEVARSRVAKDELNALADEDVVALSGESGALVLVRQSASPIRARDGRELGVVYSLQNVTTEWRKKQELAHAARHDPLTGLFNRNAFDQLLRAKIATADRAPFALLYLDLDYFKALNDFGGHAAGDAALRSVAKKIEALLPTGGVAARLGGDEFAIAMPLTSTGDVEELASALIAEVGTIQVLQTGAHPPLGGSIGIAIISQPDSIPADVLACADDACYAAKSSGRNRYAVFSESRTGNASGLTAARIVAELAEGKTDGRLQLYGQEIRLISDPYTPCARVEVLARLADKAGGFIPPSEFIPAAERFGMAAALDRWIIRTALLRHGGALSGDGALTLGFNLSAQTLSDPMLWEFVDTAICESGAQPTSIVFEITETTAFTNIEAAERFFRSARDRGCLVSLDDFGAGLSSFQYLRRFPINSIKIDGAFIENLAQSPFDRAIVASITGIASSVGYNVIAEKIEDEKALAILQELNVTYGQGFLLHHPEPLERVIERMGLLQSAPQKGAASARINRAKVGP
jgi:diguanylate cyclase (GGDEF)-like protein/PAS domain S-box-containing protein